MLYKAKRKFMEKLYFYSRKKLRNLILNSRKVDTKCSHCLQWESMVGLDHGPSEYLQTDFGYAMVCANCKQTTFFNIDAAPFPLRCDASGRPYE